MSEELMPELAHRQPEQSKPKLPLPTCMHSTEYRVQIQEDNSVDSGAGFLIEENYDDGPASKKLKPSAEAQASRLPEITECELCQTQFDESFLKKHFDYSVCDACR